MKILSIDFNAIMYPCIKLYNGDTFGGENPTIIWNLLEEKYDIHNYIKYDSIVYHDIVKLIVKNCKNNAKLIPIENHDQIVDYLKGKNLLEDAHDIVNIDFYHDIAYQDTSFQNYEFNIYTYADWGGFLLNKNEKTTMKWMRCPGSDNYQIPHEFTNFTIDKIQNIKSLPEDYDLVFLCLSPQWVPYEYQHLYDLIVDIIESFGCEVIKSFPKEPINKLVPVKIVHKISVYDDGETIDEQVAIGEDGIEIPISNEQAAAMMVEEDSVEREPTVIENNETVIASSNEESEECG